MIRVRIRETRQVLEMAPAPATAMILGGTADQVNERGEVIPFERSNEGPKLSIETQMTAPAAETAVAPAQHARPKTPAKGNSRRSA